ncbi:AMP-binding protein [Fulvimarina sp. MAC8]|uniref:AMP-binding protein n=1 Tax=Fulvimarina sp. MAC8 TaxID=3162874 RepID=UPI0032EBBD8E
MQHLSATESVGLKRENDSIIARLERRCVETPAMIGLRFYEDDSTPFDQAVPTSWSWRELANRAKQVARQITTNGLSRKGSRLLVVYPPGLPFLAAFLGCLYAGAIAVPVPAPRRTDGISRWLHIARDAGISGILCADDLLETLRPLQQAIGHGFCLAPEGAESSNSCGPVNVELAFTAPEGHEIAFLQYTSGSTSEPKGVMVTHGNLIANLEQMAIAARYGSSDRAACWLPHYHDMGLIDGLLAPIYNGFPAWLMAPASFLRRPIRFLHLVTHARATVIGGPNFAYQHCADKFTAKAAAGLDLSSLRITYSGAEPVRPDTLRQFTSTFEPFGFRWQSFYCCYGQAEATLFQAGNRPEEPPIVRSMRRADLATGRRLVEAPSDTPAEDRVELAACGRPAKGLEMALVDPETLKRVDKGTVAEIWIKGPNVSPGYWGRSRLNAETFDQHLEGSGGWRRTGDLGAMIEDQIYIVGRLKDLIIIRGQNYFPEDIEQTVFSCHPGLAQGRAGVFGLEIDGTEQVGVVCELTREGLRGLDEDEVFRTIRAAVSRGHNLKLAAIALIRPGNLPRTPSGKVRRFACRDGLVKGELRTVAEWKARPQAKLVAPAMTIQAGWKERLRQEPPTRRKQTLRQLLREEIAILARLPTENLPDVSTGFFDLGMDSLALVNLSASVERELEIETHDTMIFEFPTIKALADHLLGQIDLGETQVRAEPSQTSHASKPALEPGADNALASEAEALRSLLAATGH